MTESDSPFPGVAQTQSRQQDRDNSDLIPANAIPAPVDFSSIASAALDAAADVFLIHRARFEPPARSTGELGRARQAAVVAAVDLGAMSPWEASKAFALDLSTVKHALRRVPERADADRAYAGKALAVRAALARRLAVLKGGAP